MSLITASLLAANIVGLEFVFAPGVPTLVENPLHRTMEAQCTLETKDQWGQLMVEMKTKTATVNGIHLNTGENLSTTFVNGAGLRITAEVGAQIEMTNRGDRVVRAVCSI